MADKFPSTFVDKDTGRIKKFQTALEKLSGEIVPSLGHVALIGAKAVLLAPFVGGLVVMAPVAVGVTYIGKKIFSGLVNKMHEKFFLKGFEVDDFKRLDPSSFSDVEKWKEIAKGKHPHFMEECKKLAEIAGLKETPKILVIDQFFKKSAKSKFAGMVSDYMAGTTSRPDGGRPIILLGKGAIEELTPEEMRAVMAHEFTHLALEHPKKNISWFSRMPLNTMLNAGLLVAAVYSALPVLPILGFIIATNIAGRALKSIESRHKEEMADRGAALITGGTGDLGTALEKIRAAMMKYRKLEIVEEFKAVGKQPPDPKHPYFRLKNAWKTFVDGTHPPNEKRSALLEDFGRKHSSYCDMRKAEFKAAFNGAAAYPQKPAEPANANIPPVISGRKFG